MTEFPEKIQLFSGLPKYAKKCFGLKNKKNYIAATLKLTFSPRPF
jgi:hypothetical protein